MPRPHFRKNNRVLYDYSFRTESLLGCRIQLQKTRNPDKYIFLVRQNAFKTSTFFQFEMTIPFDSQEEKTSLDCEGVYERITIIKFTNYNKQHRGCYSNLLRLRYNH